MSYDIKPANGKCQTCTVNQQQLHDLKLTLENEESNDCDTSVSGLQEPICNPEVRLNDTFQVSHQYVTCSKGGPQMLCLSTIVGMG